MASLVNPFFKKNTTLDQNLLDTLITESIRVQGQTYYYLPREIQQEDLILGEDIVSKFGFALEIEMYQESSSGWTPEENILSKFGLQMQNQINFVLSRQSWETQIQTYPGIATMKTEGYRPQEGDLIYEPVSKSLLEIKYVANTNSDFFQFGKVYQYKLTCEFFQYSSEKIVTGNADIDAFNVNSFDLFNYNLLTEGGDALLLDEGCGYILLDGNVDVPTEYTRSFGTDYTTDSLVNKFDVNNPFGE